VFPLHLFQRRGGTNAPFIMGFCFDIVWFLRYNCLWKGSTWDSAIASCSLSTIISMQPRPLLYYQHTICFCFGLSGSLTEDSNAALKRWLSYSCTRGCGYTTCISGSPQYRSIFLKILERRSFPHEMLCRNRC